MNINKLLFPLIFCLVLIFATNLEVFAQRKKPVTKRVSAVKNVAPPAQEPEVQNQPAAQSPVAQQNGESSASLEETLSWFKSRIESQSVLPILIDNSEQRYWNKNFNYSSCKISYDFYLWVKTTQLTLENKASYTYSLADIDPLSIKRPLAPKFNPDKKPEIDPKWNSWTISFETSNLKPSIKWESDEIQKFSNGEIKKYNHSENSSEGEFYFSEEESAKRAEKPLNTQ